MSQNEKELLVSACGIYCGACHRFKKGKCPGCAENHAASWCKIRVCTKERGYVTCAECQEVSNANNCSKFNTFVSKIFSFLFRSDRVASLRLISKVGVAQYAEIMAEKDQSVIKK